ncbi:hypothetical protein [Virgibacillus alimentarius]|uniref:Uncharacterized protein n=1 Tax=Virgibacillus alimentarius TaxID=698769 RepID=A0ABS4S4J5_9BACI|nr:MULTISPECIES: hypothetical protein [Virgibacillus]MBP2256403.1 hypothetical protein [Virgibacillus alimentarius]HLR66348.1 hypothetical protein [Virgibacillus sp.]
MNSQSTEKDGDQETDLKKLVNEIQHEEKQDEHEQPLPEINEPEEFKKIDVLNLPPRKEVHNQTQWTHVKLRKPFGRLIAVIILLLIITLSAYFLWREDVLITIF